MKPRSLALRIALLPNLAFFGDDVAAQRPQNPTIASYAEMVRKAYSGDRALETVAFVASRWRLAGNRGFDASIHHVAELLERAGYVRREEGGDEVLSYRIETRPMGRPTWEPVDASLTIAGEDEPLLQFASNRNMLAINSFTTPEGGVEGELVHVGAGRPGDFEGVDVAGKIVFAETSIGGVFREAVQERGALGVLAYRLAGYTHPEVHRDSIQFSRIPLDPDRRPWGILLSNRAKERLLEALAEGGVRVTVKAQARVYDSQELTLVADVKGSERPDERFVFSAHVQEPGANDNASGVGALAEVARTAAELVRSGALRPRRSITFLWGDEISSTRRYIQDDPARAQGILWGLSLDMVGEDTAKTGGTFLIEKMPDPSAIWTRGEDRHSEWGGRPMTEEDMTPHYFNDFALARCLDQAAASGWVVQTNPFEGGSDHTPFLRAGKPGLLFWHFTDVYYHTDGDRIDKVSPVTLKNVGVSGLVSALSLANADGVVARFVVDELERAGRERLETEFALSRAAVRDGGDRARERHILETWTDWYAKAIAAIEELEVGGSSPETRQRIRAAVGSIEARGKELGGQLGRDGGVRN